MADASQPRTTESSSVGVPAPAQSAPGRSRFDAEELHLWQSLVDAKRTVMSRIDAALQESSGLSTADFAVLVLLSAEPVRPLRMKEVCQALGWARSRVSHQITRMEARGLVQKSRSSRDGRGVTVEVTPRGVEKLAAAGPRYVEVARSLVMQHISRSAFPIVEETVQKIVAAAAEKQLSGQIPAPVEG